jgi:thioredoxin 1
MHLLWGLMTTRTSEQCAYYMGAFRFACFSRLASISSISRPPCLYRNLCGNIRLNPINPLFSNQSSHSLAFYSSKQINMTREPVHITSHNDWETNVKQRKGLTVVDFSAEWCGPCRMLEPILKKAFASEQLKDVHFVKADVDQNNALAGEYQVTAVPTLILFVDGKVVDRHQGLINEKKLCDFVAKSM